MHITIRTVVAERLFNDMAPASARRYPGWLVDFATAYGDGRGWWMGAGFSLTDADRPAPPPLDTPLRVELDCGSDFTWNIDIAATEPAPPQIARDGTAITLRGLLAAADATGLTQIRLGGDLVAVMAHGAPPPVGTPVALRVRRLFLYPTGEAPDQS